MNNNLLFRALNKNLFVLLLILLTLFANKSLILSSIVIISITLALGINLQSVNQNIVSAFLIYIYGISIAARIPMNLKYFVTFSFVTFLILMIKSEFNSNKTKIQNFKMKPKYDLKNLASPSTSLIIALFLLLPEVIFNTTKRLAAQFDGYDNVVHFGITQKLIECSSSIINCNQNNPTPLDYYPSAWHLSFSSLSFDLDLNLTEKLIFYSIIKICTLFLAFEFMKTAFKNVLGLEAYKKFGFYINIFVYLGPLTIFVNNGWPSYTLAISILVWALSQLYLASGAPKAIIGLLVASLLHSVFWPFSLLAVSYAIKKTGIFRVNTFFYGLLTILPFFFFILDWRNAELENYVFISSPRNNINLALLLVLLVIFSNSLLNKNVNKSPMFYFMIMILILSVPALIWLELRTGEASYFLGKFLGISPFIGMLVFLSKFSLSEAAKRPAKRPAKQAALVFLIALWSTPIAIIPKDEDLKIYSFARTIMINYEYGTRQSPLKQVIKNISLGFNKNIGRNPLYIDRAESIIKLAEQGENKKFQIPLYNDRYFYSNGQWINAVNGTWTSEIQEILDQAQTFSNDPAALKNLLETSSG